MRGEELIRQHIKRLRANGDDVAANDIDKWVKAAEYPYLLQYLPIPVIMAAFFDYSIDKAIGSITVLLGVTAAHFLVRRF